MERKSFMVYMTWEELVDRMTDEELRRFIKNLFRFHRDEKVVLATRLEEMTWIGIQPALVINNDKYQKKVAASKENGKQGGAPTGNQNASKSKTTQNNPNNPITDKREQKTDKSKKKNEKGKKETGNPEQEKEEREQVTDDSITSTGAYSGKYTGAILLVNEIDEINHSINTQYNDAQPEGKDSYFKYCIISKLKEKILATGLVPDNLFDYFKPVYFDEIKRKLAPEEYDIVVPMFLEYMKLEFNHRP